MWVRAVPSELGAGGGAACSETVNKLRSSVATPGLASLRQPSVELSLYKVRDTSSARPRVGPLDETPCPLDGPRVAALPPNNTGEASEAAFGGAGHYSAGVFTVLTP